MTINKPLQSILPAVLLSCCWLLGNLPVSYALTGVDELTDIQNGEPAAKSALQNMVEKYDVIEGYPDKTFRGDKSASRWELVSALNRMLTAIGRDIAKLENEKGNQADIQRLYQIQNELQNKLISLSGDVKELKGKVTQIESKNTEQDTRLSILEKTQIHGDMSLGGLSDMSSDGTRRAGTHGANGILDGLSAIGRVRLTVDVPVIDDKDKSLLGAGGVHTRLIAAYGRFSPQGAGPGNGGAYDPFNLYSRISADVSAFNEGYATGSVGALRGLNGNTAVPRPNVYMESAFYSQHFKSGIPLLTDLGVDKLVCRDKSEDWKTTGDLYAGIVRWWDLFDISPYRGNELNQFQNMAFINIPGIAVNVAQPMTAYVWHQGLGKNYSMDISTGLGSIDVGNITDGMNLTYEARLNYRPGFLGEKYAKPGSLYAGAYHIFQAGNTNYQAAIASLPNRSGGIYPGLGKTGTANAFYTGWNQEWSRGIGTNIGYLLNDSNANNVAYTSLQPGPGQVAAAAQQTMTSVISVPISAIRPGWRDKDVLGIGYSLTQIQKGGLTGTGFVNTPEKVGELYYKLQLNDSVSIIPSVQIIMDRLGLKANGTTTVLGLRMSYVF